MGIILLEPPPLLLPLAAHFPLSAGLYVGIETMLLS
jgi:hypothetical protein